MGKAQRDVSALYLMPSEARILVEEASEVRQGEDMDSLFSFLPGYPTNFRVREK